MTWTYRSPLTFPARYPMALRSAVALLGDPVPLFTGTHQECLVEAERFRYYRWCVRAKPADRALTSYFLSYAFRTSLSELSPGIWSLSLTAKPAALSELQNLNPHLVPIIRRAVA